MYNLTRQAKNKLKRATHKHNKILSSQPVTHASCVNRLTTRAKKGYDLSVRLITQVRAQLVMLVGDDAQGVA